jgi:hypothetical protein
MRLVKLMLTFVITASAVLIVSGCSVSASSNPSSDMKPPDSMSMMDTTMQNVQYPDYVKNAPPTVHEAYEFALSHQKEMQKYPCFCGCGRMGHTSNLSCYIKDVDSKGKVTFDSHASGCGICVDITKDVKRLLAEGKSSKAIRTYIDATYSPYGPSTNTAFPTE